eukprot:6239074-Amphidinium_carterae.1
MGPSLSCSIWRASAMVHSSRPKTQLPQRQVDSFDCERIQRHPAMFPKACGHVNLLEALVCLRQLCVAFSRMNTCPEKRHQVSCMDGGLYLKWKNTSG